MSTATNGTQTLPAVDPFAGKASEGGGDFEIVPAGNHPAQLVCIYDLGTHDETFQGEPKSDVRKLFFAWELSEFDKNGKPFVIGKEYTVGVNADKSFSFGERSNLRKMLEGWRGSKYNPGESVSPMKCLGKPCLVSVTHTAKGDKTYHNMSGVTATPKGMGMPKFALEPFAYHISMGAPEVRTWLPKLWHSASAKMLNPDEIAGISKEKEGRPIGNGKPKDTPYSQPATVGGNAPAAVEDDDIPF